MIEFKSWRLKGMPFFHNQSFDLSYKGISLILGKNLDSSNDNPNGAGKSYFFSELAELVMNEPVIGERKDVTRKGARELEFSKNGHSYRVTRSFSPREKLSISRDGKDLEYRELAAAQAFLKKLLPYSDKEVLSLLFLDSRVPHPLTRGSAAARREFFLRFFHMSAAPSMRKVIKSELDKLAESVGVLKHVREEIKELKGHRSQSGLEEIATHIDTINADLIRADFQVKAYSKVRRVLEAYQSYSNELSALAGLGVLRAEQAAELEKKLEARLEKIDARLLDWATYARWKAQYAENIERRESLLSKLPEELVKNPKASISLLDEAVSSNGLRIKKIEAKIVALQEDDAVGKAREARRKVKRLEAQIKEASQTGDTCPTCGAAWSNAHAKAELKALRGKLEKASIELEAAEKLAEEHAGSLGVYQARLNVLEEKIAIDESNITKLHKLVSISEDKSPGKPDTSKEDLDSRKTELRSKLKILNGAGAALASKASYESLTKEERALAKGEDPTTEYIEISERLSEAKRKYVEAELRTKRYTELRASRDRLKSELAEKPALDLLFEAFSKKGVEALMIKTVTDRLSQLVNKYAKFLFPEDYTFSFDLESQFSFLVKRRYGKREEVSDVRKLSGAESLLFNLVLYVALLSFVPEKNRPSILMLDEPTAAFGPEMIESFVKFLPVLNSVVPHLIVITPMPYVDYANAKVWTMVKKNGQSRLIPGVYKAGVAAHDLESARNTSTKPSRASPSNKRARVAV